MIDGEAVGEQGWLTCHGKYQWCQCLLQTCFPLELKWDAGIWSRPHVAAWSWAFHRLFLSALKWEAELLHFAATHWNTAASSTHTFTLGKTALPWELLTVQWGRKGGDSEQASGDVAEHSVPKPPAQLGLTRVFFHQCVQVTYGLSWALWVCLLTSNTAFVLCIAPRGPSSYCLWREVSNQKLFSGPKLFPLHSSPRVSKSCQPFVPSEVLRNINALFSLYLQFTGLSPEA